MFAFNYKNTNTNKQLYIKNVLSLIHSSSEIMELYVTSFFASMYTYNWIKMNLFHWIFILEENILIKATILHIPCKFFSSEAFGIFDLNEITSLYQKQFPKVWFNEEKFFLIIFWWAQHFNIKLRLTLKMWTYRNLENMYHFV